MTDSETRIKIANNRLMTTERRYWTASVVSLLTIWMVWPYISTKWGLIAGAVLILASHVMSVITWLFWRDQTRDTRPDYWERWLVTGNLLAGSTVGVTTAMLYLAVPPDISPRLVMIAALLIGAWSTANVPSMKCIYAFFISAITPIIIAIMLQGQVIDYVQGLIIITFFSGILKHARLVSSTYRASADQVSGLQVLANLEARQKELISNAYARQSELLDSIPVPIIVSRYSDGKLLYYNSKTIAITGLPPQMENRTLLSYNFFVDPQKRDEIAKEIEQHGGVHDFEMQLKRSDGSTFWAFFSTSLIEYQGAPAVISTFTDITSRLVAEDARRQSDEKLLQATEQINVRLRDLLDSMPVPIVVSKRDDGLMLYMNRIALDLAGVKNLSDMPGARGIDFFADAQLAERLGAKITAEKDIPEEEYKDIEFQLKRPDGSSMWVFYSANQMVYEGQPAIIGTFTDISVRHQAEEELRKSEEKFRMLADHAHDMISIYSPASICLYVSPSVERLFGYRPDEFIGRPLSNFIHPEDFETIISNNAWSVEAGEDHPVYLCRMSHKSGHWEWVEATNTIEVDPVTGKITQVSSVSRVVTERIRNEQALREARERAEAADRAKSDFLAHMSHEIRTPLNAVIGFSEVMRDQLFGPLGSERYLEYINDIHNSGTHLLELINEVLDLSKIEAGKLELQEDRVPLDAIIDKTFRFVRERAESKLIALQCSLHAAPDLWCDRRVFTQVMLNIVGNAIKFTPERGRITVESSLDTGGNLVLTVTDTGIGIAQEDIPMVMKPFGQARSSSHIAAAEPGTGLGLPLSKSFIEKHQGTLSVTSEPGIGTRVIIIIPASRVMDDNEADFVSASF